MSGTDPIPSFSDEELSAVDAVEALAFDHRFDILCHNTEHLILQEAWYLCEETLFLSEANLSDSAISAFGKSNHVIDRMDLDQTALNDQHTAELSITLDGVDYKIKVINDSATISFTSLATLNKVTRKIRPELIAEILAGTILSTADDPTAVRLRAPVIEIDNAEKIVSFSKALAQIQGSFGTRVVSAFSEPGQSAMIALVEETEDPRNQTVTSNLSLGYATEASKDIIDTNHVTAAVLAPSTEEQPETRGSTAHLPVALGDYVFYKQNELLEAIDVVKVDKQANPEEWVKLCSRFWSIVHPLLGKYELD